MGFIRKQRNRICVLGLLAAFCLTGCGSKVAGDTKVTVAVTGEEGDTETEVLVAEADSETLESAGSTKGDRGEENADRIIPVYGEEDKEEIKKWLAGLPDDFLKYEQQAALGVLLGSHSSLLYSEEARKNCEEEWLEIYTKNNEHDQMLERGKREKQFMILEERVLSYC